MTFAGLSLANRSVSLPLEANLGGLSPNDNWACLGVGSLCG